MDGRRIVIGDYSREMLRYEMTHFNGKYLLTTCVTYQNLITGKAYMKLCIQNM